MGNSMFHFAHWAIYSNDLAKLFWGANEKLVSLFRSFTFTFVHFRSQIQLARFSCEMAALEWLNTALAFAFR